MAINSSILPASALLTSFKVINFALTLANTEYQVDIPIGAKKYTLKARDGTLLKIADSAGLSGTVYFSLPPYCDYNVDSLIGADILSLFVQSTNPNQVLEIKYWI